MIRVHLTADDIARVRIADSPDVCAELGWAGYQLATGVRTGRLSQWRKEVARGWNPGAAKLFDLFSATSMPGLDGVVSADPAATARAVAATDPEAMGYYLRTLTRFRGMTPFTRALADGHEPAYNAFGQAVADLQTAAMEPYRRRIASQVATAAAHAGVRAAASGMGAMLSTLHPQVSLSGRVLSLPSARDYDFELDGRALVVRPSALAVKPGLSGDVFTDKLELYYPATETPLARDPLRDAPDPALAALLGATRSQVLAAIVRAPAVTTGQLASDLGLSPAAASRHATVLRDAGLITTFRNGMTVHHHPTPLGIDLAVRERST